MISEAHFGPSHSNPTFLMWLKDMDAPRFSGKIEDFMDWKIALNQFMELMSPAQGGLSNAMKLEILNRALDPTNRNILQAHRENGGSYEHFMQSLDGRYMGDVQLYHRRSWDILSFPHPARITREDLRNFRAQFEKCKNRVLDATAEDVYGQLMSKLPISWHEEIVAEEDKRNGGGPWVRIN
jgi:hypothetical protein